MFLRNNLKTLACKLPFINFVNQSTFNEGIPEYEKDLASIRTMMERSAKFLSLSGLSGVLAGVYALIGAAAAYFMAHYPISPFDYRQYLSTSGIPLSNYYSLRIVLVASISTGLAKQPKGEEKWA